MGTCYKILMLNEGGWDPGYLAKFMEAWEKIRYAPDLEGSGDDWAIFDIDKTFPVIDKYHDLIVSFCDAYYYWADTSIWDVQRGRRLNPLPPKQDYREEKRAKFTIEDLNKKLSENSL